MGATREIARWASDLRFDMLPEKVVDRMKLSLFDAVGCAIFGATIEHCQQVIGVVKKLGGKRQATILGTGAKTSAYNAAMANGTMIQGFELDDVGVFCHPAACVVPAGLAMAEARGGIDGESLLTALVAGYESSIRIAECIGIRPEALMGWHTPPFYGSIGSAVCAGKIMGLDEEQMFQTIGIAADNAASGLIAAKMGAAATKSFHCGRAAAIGVLSALLAEAGFKGVPDVVEREPFGYCWALTGYNGEGEKPWDTAVITRGLGQDYVFADRVSLKYYPVVGPNLSALDNVRQLKHKYGITADMIDRISVAITRMIWEGRAMGPVDDIHAANLSTPFAVAVGLLYDIPPVYESPLALDVWREKFKDPAVQALLLKVEEVVDEELNARKPYSNDTTVVVRLKDGRELRQSSDYQKDAPSVGTIRFRSTSQEDIRNKFRNLVAGVLSKKATEAVTDWFDRIDESEDVTSVFPMLKPRR